MSIVTDIVGFFTLKSFSNPVNDKLMSLRDRVGGQRLTYVGHGPGGYTIADLRIDISGTPRITVLEHKDTTVSFDEVMRIAKSKRKSRLLILSVSDGDPQPFATTSSSRLPEKELAMRLSNKPVEIIGSGRFSADRRYSGFFHPEMSQGVFCSFTGQTEAMIPRAAELYGFNVVRVTVSLIPLLDLALADPRVRTGKAHPFIIDQGVATYVSVGPAGEWFDVRSRPFIGGQPLKSFMEELANSTDAKLLVLIGECNGGVDVLNALRAVPRHELFTSASIGINEIGSFATSLN